MINVMCDIIINIYTIYNQNCRSPQAILFDYMEPPFHLNTIVQCNSFAILGGFGLLIHLVLNDSCQFYLVLRIYNHR